MNQTIFLALIGNIPSVCGALSAILAAYFAYKAHVTADETKKISKHTEQNTNNMKDELVAEVRKASFAAGVKSETDKQ